jgi:CBS domain-containing protein
VKRRAIVVSDILKSKGAVVTTIKPQDTIGELSRQLQRLRIGAMVVSRDGVTLDGIISERDIAYALALYRSELHALPVAQLMTKQVLTCAPDDKLAGVAKIMAEHHIRHVPVLDGKMLVGVISMRDVAAHRLTELQRIAELMKSHLR